MAPPTSLLRPALELAWVVAREGGRLTPPVAAPGPMRPLLRFARLPGRALDTVRHILDEDAAFRDRVAAVADESALGRVPWLWLVRPAGWTEELASASAASEVRSGIEDDRRAERTAQRRLGLVEAALQRTNAALDESREARAVLTSELNDLRQERRADLEAAQADREALVAAGKAEADALSRADAAIRRLADLEPRLVAAEERLAASEATNTRLTDQLERGREAQRVSVLAREAEQRRRGSATSDLGRAVGEAASAARDLGGALARAALVLGRDPELEPGDTAAWPDARAAEGQGPDARAADGQGPDARAAEGRGPDARAADSQPSDPRAADAQPSERPTRPGGSSGGGTPASPGEAGPEPSGDGEPELSEPRGRAQGRSLRRPAPLPAAVLDDSPAATSWLMRLPGAVLVVDGYNVTLHAWAGRDLPDQRHRLVMALAELSMRTGAEVEVVFDGAEDHAHPLRSLPARRPVRITFSPPGLDADELIIERVTRLPAARPVIVATNDRRVRDECTRAGANLLSTEQLVTALGRGYDPGRP